MSNTIRTTWVSAFCGSILLFSISSVAKAQFTTLKFDTELVSLDLSGGPYPMPLASDPGNARPGSVMGYGIVDSSVMISLTPGMPSLGEACAYQATFGTDAGQLECFFDPIEKTFEPIDPAELDGGQFFVHSVFNVFFDITVTDVDSRPGHDFAGQAPGASIPFTGNGPAKMQSQPRGLPVTFDKDAPNFGLLPPPQSDPYIGPFDIEIPLGGDINGNGEDDKVKFQLVSHAAGDGNRTFAILPDGTVLDTFNSAAFLAGAVVDVSADPPFTLGAGSQSMPAFSGSGALTGPTTAAANLLNPVVPEPSTAVLLAMGLMSLLGLAAGRTR